MHLVRVGNIVVNLKVMTDCAYDPGTPSKLDVYFPTWTADTGEYGGMVRFTGPEADSLWEYLCSMCPRGLVTPPKEIPTCVS